MKRKKYLLFLLLIPVIILIGRSFALPINSEVKTIELQSEDYNNAGSFRIEKKVDWEESGKAEITYTVNTVEKNVNNKYKDVVLIIDTSSSMNEGKLEKAKNDSIELIRMLLSDLNNRVALITFSNNSTIKSDFTNNKEELESLLNTLTINNKANFNNALLKVDELLNNYDKLDNHDLIVLFLTDGNPNEGVPNDQATYGMLKDKYQDIVINGIQYEKEKSITDEIKNISDNQFLVSDRNILNEAILTSVPYEKFNVVEIINNEHFNVSSIDDIKVNNGNIELTNENGNQKINWNLSGIKSGVTSTMKVTINLNSNLINQSDLYKVNNTTTINSKLEGESEKALTSDKTLLLKNKYNVTYDLNKPGNCDLDSISSESHFVGDIVTKKTQSLYCDGYVVKSWEIKGEDNLSIKNINSSSFMMPSTDITIRAVWAKNGIVKSMDGVVLEKANTLYRVLQDAAIDGTYAKEYTGPHQDSNTKNGTKKIYHWYAAMNDDEKGVEIPLKYNVQFGNRCWRMIRTTDTGGVRLLYNGEFDETLKCGSGRGHKEDRLYEYTTMRLYSNGTSYNVDQYYYADSFSFNPETNKYTLVNAERKTVNLDNFQDFIGKYTCYYEGTTECSRLYKIVSFQQSSWSGDEKSLYMIYEYDNSYYSTDSYYGPMISSSVSHGISGSSLSNYGYMFGDSIHRTESMTLRYPDLMFDNSSHELFEARKKSDYITGYYKDGYVADSFRFAYGDTKSSTSSYYVRETFYIDNPVPVTSLNDLSEMIGKYYVSWYYDDYSTRSISYIIDVDDTNVYYIQYDAWDQDEFIPFSSIYFGNSVTENDDGTYTIDNAVEVKPGQMIRTPQQFVNKIMCFGGLQTCERPIKITRVSGYDTSYWIYYESIGRKILIAKNRNGTELSDTLVISIDDLIENYDNYKDYKYTCRNLSSTCTEENLSLINGTYSYNGSYGGSYKITYLYNYQNEFYFGSDAIWDGTKYTLVDPLEFEVLDDEELASTHHYFCYDYKATSCEKVYYIISMYMNNSGSSSKTFGFIVLKDGENDIQKIYDDMMKKNIYDSNIKAIIDEWYTRHMIKYTDYLEDAVYCNDRKPLYNDNSFTSKNGKVTNEYSPRPLSYNSYENYLSGSSPSPGDFYLSLKCEWETDRFSMDNPKAQLKYPVGMITYDEMALMNNRKARSLSASTYTMSGFVIVLNDGYVRSSSGYPTSPAITLKPGTEYISGDGSPSNPYVVDTSEVDG